MQRCANCVVSSLLPAAVMPHIISDSIFVMLVMKYYVEALLIDKELDLTA